MARNVNVNYSNLQSVTGTRAVQRYSVAVQLTWVNEDGTPLAVTSVGVPAKGKARKAGRA